MQDGSETSTFDHQVDTPMSPDILRPAGSTEPAMRILGEAVAIPPNVATHQELSEEGKADEVEQLVAYAAATPEDDNALRLWLDAFDPDKIAAFLRREDCRGTTSLEVLVALDHRDDVKKLFADGKLPEAKMELDAWLLQSMRRKGIERKGVIDVGRSGVATILQGVKRELKEPEERALVNWARSIEDPQVILRALSFAKQHCSVAMAIMNNPLIKNMNGDTSLHQQVLPKLAKFATININAGFNSGAWCGLINLLAQNEIFWGIVKNVINLQPDSYRQLIQYTEIVNDNAIGLIFSIQFIRDHIKLKNWQDVFCDFGFYRPQMTSNRSPILKELNKNPAIKMYLQNPYMNPRPGKNN